MNFTSVDGNIASSMNTPIIIGFVGLPFTGKSTSREVTEKLLDDMGHKWHKAYFGGIVVDEVERRDGENGWNEEQAGWTFQQKEKYIRESLREQHGLGAMAKLSIPEIDAAIEAGEIVLIDDLYSEEEREILVDKYGEENLTLVAMAADWKVRVERAKHREVRPLNEEELAHRDLSEIHNLHKAPPIALAHFTIVNNSFERADFEKSVESLRHEIETRVLPSIL
ncbi:MAG: Dephospho-CoA kinase [Candidatus Saccharibacteria bacterium]|nr:Dephospho-CoA kinase [Candidatus Saccharibacteria bacterium]